MNNIKLLTACVFMTAAFFINSCNWDYKPEGGFDNTLQGTWISNDRTIYSGKLEITYDRITITGYSGDQTPIPGGDDNQRPFRDFTKNAALKGYSEKSENPNDKSEKGLIYIEDAGILQEGIPYTYYWSDSPPPDYRTVYFLRFTFGGRIETLQKSDIFD